jgi:hypothetical protein
MAVVDFMSLCHFLSKAPSPVVFPERKTNLGFTPAEIKRAFIERYPSSVHKVLRGYPWPYFDRMASYWVGVVDEIHADLHARALMVWQAMYRPAP